MCLCAVSRASPGGSLEEGGQAGPVCHCCTRPRHATALSDTLLSQPRSLDLSAAPLARNPKAASQRCLRRPSPAEELASRSPLPSRRVSSTVAPRLQPTAPASRQHCPAWRRAPVSASLSPCARASSPRCAGSASKRCARLLTCVRTGEGVTQRRLTWRQHAPLWLGLLPNTS